MSTARQPLTWGEREADERLTRYERGLGIPLRAEGIGAPPRLTGREAQSSPVASSFSRGCRVIADCFALFVIPLITAFVLSVCAATVGVVGWFVFDAARSCVEAVLHFLNLS